MRTKMHFKHVTRHYVQDISQRELVLCVRWKLSSDILTLFGLFVFHANKTKPQQRLLWRKWWIIAASHLHFSCMCRIIFYAPSHHVYMKRTSETYDTVNGYKLSSGETERSEILIKWASLSCLCLRKLAAIKRRETGFKWHVMQTTQCDIFTIYKSTRDSRGWMNGKTFASLEWRTSSLLIKSHVEI